MAGLVAPALLWHVEMGRGNSRNISRSYGRKEGKSMDSFPQVPHRVEWVIERGSEKGYRPPDRMNTDNHAWLMFIHEVCEIHVLSLRCTPFQ